MMDQKEEAKYVPVKVAITSTAAKMEVEFVPVRTNAPIAYDGMGTIELYTSDVWHPGEAGKHPDRVVIVDSRHLNWQLGRYASGWNHSEFEDGEQIAIWIQEKLWARLRGREDK